MDWLLFAFFAALVLWTFGIVWACLKCAGKRMPKPVDHGRVRQTVDDILRLSEYEEVEVLGPSGNLHVVYPIRSNLHGFVIWARIYIISSDRPVKILIEGSVFMNLDDEVFAQHLLAEFDRQGSPASFTSPAPIPLREEIVDQSLLRSLRKSGTFVSRQP